MKKALTAFALAMMGILFVGCNKEVEPDRDVANKIIGKWIYAENDGKVLPTNEKVVYEFVSATKAYVSLSFTDDASSGTGAPWTERNEVDVNIVGNDVTMTHSPEPGKTVTVDLHVNAITGTTMIGKRNVTVRKDGGLVKADEYAEYFVAGNLLCTRWKNAGEGTQELREWWEIMSLDDQTMIWGAIRQDDYGQRYPASFALSKVE